ncbi:MAG: hypothetical protein AAFP19_12090 [Bacteroidota bacterium]
MHLNYFKTLGFALQQPFGFTLLIFSFLFTPYSLSAQNWENLIEYGNNLKINDIQSDDFGYVYVEVNNNLVGNDLLGLIIPRGHGVLTFNEQKELVAATMIEGITDINWQVDKKQNLFVTGRFLNTIELGDTSLTPTDDQDIFMAKYDCEGQLNWVKQFDGNSQLFRPNILVDQQENVYLTGTFTEAFTVDSTTLEPVPNSDKEVYLLKINPDLELEWIRDLRAYSNYDIAMGPDDHLHILCSKKRNAVISLPGQTEAGLYKIAPDGSIVWLTAFRPLGVIECSGLVVDRDGAAHLCGSFTGGLRFPDGSEFDVIDFYDNFIAKVDRNGEFIWASQIGGQGDEDEFAITVDPQKNVYMASDFTTEVQFNGDTYPALGGIDIFVVQLDSNGQHQNILVTGSDGTDNPMFGMVSDGCRVYVSGLAAEGTAFGDQTMSMRSDYVVGMFFPGMPEDCSTLPEVNCGQIITSTNASISESSLQIFPNPSHGAIQIQVPNTQESYRYFLYDNTGRLIQSDWLPQGDRPTLEFDQAAGFYLLEIVGTTSQNRYLEKIIFQ